MESQCIYHLSSLMRIGTQLEVSGDTRNMDLLVTELKNVINTIAYMSFHSAYSFENLNPMITSATTVLRFQLYRFCVNNNYDKYKMTTIYALLSQVANDDKSGI